MKESKESNKVKNKSKGDALRNLFERPKKSYTISGPPQMFGKTNHGVRPQLVFYFNSEKDLKIVIRAFGGKKREPNTGRLIKIAKKILKRKEANLV